MAAISEFNALESWVSQNNTSAPPIKGIPNFYSRSRFGKTSQLKDTAQFVVVAALVAVILRTFSRRRTKTKFWFDDWCAMAAVFFLVLNQFVYSVIDFIGRTSFSIIGRQNKAEEDARLRKIVAGLKLSLGFEVAYLISIFLVKFSLLFVYERFARSTKHITLYLRITQGVCLLTFTVCILSLFLSCIPVKMFWSLSNTSAQCTRRTLLTYTSGVSNIITNTLVLAVPVPLLLRATLTMRQRIGLSVLYFFGAFVIVASALRFATQLLNVSVSQAIGWSQIEISLAIILACAPMSVKLLLTPLIDPPPAPPPPSAASKHGSKMDGEFRASSLVCQLMNEEKYYAAMEYSAAYPPPPQQPNPPMRDSVIPGQQQQEQQEQQKQQKQKYPPTRPPRSERGRSIETSISTTSNDSMAVVRDVGSPGYQRLKVVRAEVNGQSVWEVRPVTPGLASARR